MNPAALGQERVIKLEQQLNQYKNELRKLEIELDELQGLNRDEDGNKPVSFAIIQMYVIWQP